MRINVERIKYIEISIEYVYRGNFNDSYYLETIEIDLENLNKEELVWIDPFNKRSKINNTLIAFEYVSDEEFVIFQKVNDNISEYKNETYIGHICCEDYDESRLLAAHINFRTRK